MEERNSGNIDYRALLKGAYLELKNMRSELEEIERTKTEPIAIIGMGCRFPGGANNPEAFWQILRDGMEGIGQIPSERWNVDAYYDPDPDAPGKMYVRHGGFLDEVDKFDPAFFGISPREAAQMDPQQRLLLEVCWEALENAGQAADELNGSQTGVFVGIGSEDYAHLSIGSGNFTQLDGHTGLGTARSIAVGRLSYILGLQGPAMQLDTSCSSSLLAIHLACQSLRSQECNLALAGGVNLMLSPAATIVFSKLKALAPDGRCKTFDDKADGYVRGEGCGIVALKRLSDALASGDNILALIRGSAVNHDGHSNGLTAPNGSAQEALLRMALKNAQLEPSDIQYIEAHGTGTSLGDPIEVLALGKILGQGRSPSDRLFIGSVKPNIGHLEAAAGVAGLIKILLSLTHAKIPPNLHFQQPNKYIPWEKLPIEVPTTLTYWPAKEGRRLAGVSSLGMSGTNVHIILESAPEHDVRNRLLPSNEREKAKIDPLQILTLSAKSEPALRELAQKYAEFLGSPREKSLADICFTANTGRSPFNHRLAVVAESHEQVLQQLNAFAAIQETWGPSSGVSKRDRPKIAFLFTGQGSQYVGMAQQLYETQITFRDTLNLCDRILRPYLEQPLLSVLYPDPGANSHLDETAYTQPALFALEYSLAQLWKSWGITPDVVMGHSVGEYVAACVAGVFTLEDGLKLIASRARLMYALPPGGEMVAVLASESLTRKSLQPYAENVSLAAINGPQNIVISGPGSSVQAVRAALEAQGIETKKLNISHAFHSRLMEPMLADFERVLKEVNFSFPRQSLISNVTGQPIRTEMQTPEYWLSHVRQPVRFATSMETLHQQGYEVFVEIGPKPTLLGMGRNCLPKVGVWLPSLHPGQSDWQQILQSLGELYVRGVQVDWSGFYRDYPRRRVALPTYPFQRQRYWIENFDRAPKKQSLSRSEPLHPLLGQKLHLAGLEKQHRFESQIAANNPAYLSHHRVFNQALLPMTAYLELSLAAGLRILNSPQLVVEDVVIQTGLILLEDNLKTVQTILTPSENGAYQFQIFSQEQENNQSEPNWICHAEGKIRLSEIDTTPKVVDLEKYLINCERSPNVVEYYQQFQERSINYGVSFQGIQKLWQLASNQALGKIQLPQELVEQATDYQLHPALLDAALQVIAAAITTTETHQTYLPVGIERLRVYRRPNAEVWAIASVSQFQGESTDSLSAQVTLLNSEGETIATVEGLRIKPATVQALLGSQSEPITNWLYEVEWRFQALFGQQLRLDYLPTPSEIGACLQPELARSIDLLGLKTYEAIFPQLELLSVAYVSQAFQEMGWNFDSSQRFSTAFIALALGVVSQHQRLLGRLLEMLAEVGMLQPISSEWEFTRIPELQDPQEQLGVLLARYPEAETELTLLGHCGSRLASVLRGECDPLQLLFPEGDLTNVTKLYQESPGARAINTLVQKAVLSAVEHLPLRLGVRILEIGAGTGGTTSYILPHLNPQQTEYVFTDVSPLFITKAQEKFRDYPFVRYQVLDIEEDPQSQGFELHQYDIIIAANVLHATLDLRQTLQNVQKLLAPNGIFLLLEGTKRMAWLDLIFGLTEGWWRFADLDLRPDYPLLTASQWKKLLLEVGYSEVKTIPEYQESQEVLSQQSVIIARGAPLQKTIAPKARNWLVFADNDGIGTQLAALLRGAGEHCTLVKAGEEYSQIGEREFSIDPEKPENFQQLLAAVGTFQIPLYGVVNCWSLNAVSARALTSSDLKAASVQGCGSTLHLVQALVKAGFSQPPRLWLVTRGAQPVGVENANVPGVAQSSLWGMGKVIALEHPELKCVRIDLDPDAGGDEARCSAIALARSLFEEILSEDAEDQIALRSQERYVARLARYQKTQDSVVVENQPYRLEISDRGTLENLTLKPTQRRQPGAGEVEILVQATGLNFRDVLNALGLYPGDPGPLGGECAGSIVAIGEGVEGFETGDGVVAVVSGSFSQYVTVNATMVALKPDILSFEEAATIPIAFLTAYYTLHHLAKISAGEAVLIHAATGGVGQAAVQLAKLAGAEVFATASTTGSETGFLGAKWEFLKSMGGIKHVMNSRTLDFAGQVMTSTSGKGVDIVLNSLTSDEFIAASLSVLGKSGRFLEIAKRGAWDDGKILKARPDISYFQVDLVQVCQQQPELIQSMLRFLLQQFEAGLLKPLPQKVFPIENVVDAFRYMQRALHVGKIVVTHPTPSGESNSLKPLTFSGDGTYLITGGMGGLGLLVAQWMVQKGVRHLVLVGRSGANSDIESKVKELEKAGAQVVVATCDVSSLEQITQVLSEIRNPASTLPPLRGIIHSVGVLDDGVLQQQKWERFEAVMAGKVEGAWNLHKLTEDLPLDLFVMFSSVASLFGSPGQANHAAANAFQDALAYHRRASGLPGLSINWGAVDSVGAAAKRQAGGWMKAKGIGTISPQQFLEVLEQQLSSQATAQVGVVPVNWSKFIEQFAPWPIFADFKGVTPASEDRHEGFIQKLEAIPVGDRVAYLGGVVRSQVATVLGIAASTQIDPQQGFFDLGMDSLTSVELRNRLQTKLGCNLPATLALKYPTVSALADYLATEVFATSSTNTRATLGQTALPAESQVHSPEVAEIRQFSQAEVEDAIAKEIEELERELRG